jgi:uncharacterized membrane protein YfcA
MYEVEALILMAISGLVIGFIAALLGIGGGMVMVPALFFIFKLTDIIPHDQMHVAAGTSLLVMVATSIGSVVSHAREGNIVWKMTTRTVPGIALGVVFGALLSSYLPTATLSGIFAVVLVLVSLTMIFAFKAQPAARPLPSPMKASAIGSIIGFKSGLLGVGGGALSVPWLTWMGISQRQVSGTSSTFTFPAAIIGTIAFIFIGLGTTDIPYTIGFVYWPALPIAGCASVFGAFVGAKFSRRAPGRLLRILFGILLLGVSVSMILAN